jgi:hypothetical protein
MDGFNVTLGNFTLSLSIGTANGNSALVITSGGGRFMSIANGGGHLEVATYASLPEGTGLELDDNGYPVVHQE